MFSFRGVEVLILFSNILITTNLERLSCDSYVTNLQHKKVACFWAKSSLFNIIIRNLEDSSIDKQDNEKS